ncbi:MAG: efflux RND transporter periplasmic adaptor subunit [Spirochaetales bacterium]|nr:efflux RND transporter periplasmic adaptor subunit [Spirochaetales bacterium]
MKNRVAFGKLGTGVVLLVILAASIGARIAAALAEQAPPEQTAMPVRVTRPSSEPLVKELRLNAFLESESMVTVLPLVSGILQDLSVDIGQRVSKGQVVARIDAARYDLQLRQAEAAWLSTKGTFERVEQLYKAGAASQQSYDQARGQYDAYRSQYELALLQLEYATVRSPIDGVVLVRHMAIGSIAAPERPLLTIGDLSRLVVRARVPERYYAEFVKPGNVVETRIEQVGGGSFAASLSSVTPFISPENRTFEATCDLVEGLDSLRPGMSAVAVFTLARREGAWSLPFDALVGESGLWYVETDAKGNDLARELSREPGFSTDERFEVPASLSGLRFIVEGQHFLKDGAAVRIVGERASP